MAKRKNADIELPTEEELEIPKKKRTRSKSYSRNKGHAYETRIARELRDLGFTGVVTSRSESKAMDDNKVDLIDKDGKLPAMIQLKSTQSIPSYFKIRSESTVNPEDFVIIWSKQEKRDVNIVSVGEAVIMDKQLFYKLIKPYSEDSK
jgi:hypothetical protein